jgi:hypothetical protein
VQPTPTVLFALLAFPFLGAAAVPLVDRVPGERTACFAALVALACFGLVANRFGTVSVTGRLSALAGFFLNALSAEAIGQAAFLLVGVSDIEELLADSTAAHLGPTVAGFDIATVYGTRPIKKKPLNRFGRKLYDMPISETPVRTREISPRGVFID